MLNLFDNFGLSQKKSLVLVKTYKIFTRLMTKDQHYSLDEILFLL